MHITKKILAGIMLCSLSINSLSFNAYAKDIASFEKELSEETDGNDNSSQLTEDEVEVEETTEETIEIIETTDVTETTEETTVVTETTEISTEGDKSTEDNNKEDKYVGKGFDVIYSISSSWNGGYNATVKIVNTGTEPIKNWYLSCDMNNKISNIWNAEIYYNNEKEYIIKNAEWNADIPVNGAVEFGISSTENFAGFPSNYKILGARKENNVDDFSIEYFVESDNGYDFTSSIIITNNRKETLEDWKIEFDFERNITNMWNGVIKSSDNYHYIVQNAEYNRNIMPGEKLVIGFNGVDGKQDCVPHDYKIESYDINDEIDFDDETDTDNDLLKDCLEKYYNTDKNKADTDGDGISDYIEIVILGSDPNSALSGPDGDSDLDGLSNIKEIEIGTNPGDDDTDCDGVADGEELNIATNPLDYDTDCDGASDGWEVANGTNPLVADQKFRVQYTSEYKDTVKANVDIELKGEQVETLAVDPLVGEMLFPKDMPGYIGCAYDFSVEGSFTEARISFDFSEVDLDDDAEPTIFYFNEEEQSLEELDTIIENNIASTTVKHFSTYILVDRKKYYDSFQWEDTWDVGKSYSRVDLVLVIDDSGSMTSNDKTNKRLSVAKDLIDKLPEGSKIGVVQFTSSVKRLTTNVVTNKNVAKGYLNNSYFKSSGGTKMYTAINSATSLFSNEEDVYKAMVVLSDGVTDDTKMHASVVDVLKKQNIHAYTIGLGNEVNYFNLYMKPLAQNTDGQFYLAQNANELSDIFNVISKKIDLQADSDNDGIVDYYEEHMVSFNGKLVKMDKNCYDTDGDGLADGDEVEVEIIYNKDKTMAYVKGKIKSYPDKVDSDNDGLSDYVDPERMEYTITDRTLSIIEGLSYTNLESYIGMSIGDLIDQGVYFENVNDENIELIRDAVINSACDSGTGMIDGFWSQGFGCVSLKFTRQKKHTAIVYALRGSEFDDDFFYDGTTDLELGVSWDSEQSRCAFSHYKSIAKNHTYDFIVCGHSLGGRLTQDVLYKIYNANEGGFFLSKAFLPEPKRADTFNALGYTKIVYATLENDVIACYKDDLVNYYYKSDSVGDALGASLVFKRTGIDVKLLGKKSDGTYLRGDEDSDGFDSKYHGILFFQDDYDLNYANIALSIPEYYYIN